MKKCNTIIQEQKSRKSEFHSTSVLDNWCLGSKSSISDKNNDSVHCSVYQICDPILKFHQLNVAPDHIFDLFTFDITRQQLTEVYYSRYGLIEMERDEHEAVLVKEEPFRLFGPEFLQHHPLIGKQTGVPQWHLFHRLVLFILVYPLFTKPRYCQL